jgi:glycosyltransferase involved in cell wall biosynthesis
VPAHRIALVVPQAVPAVIGGAENLWAGLIGHLNSIPDISAELVGLPSYEKTLPDILQTYAAFARLDLNRFNQVISTKYPAWAIHHPNHTVYLQHTLRGLYDTYPESLGYALSSTQEQLLARALPATLIRSLKAASAKSWAPAQRQQVADDCFSKFGDIASVAESLLSIVQSHPSELLAFPGNFSRACVRLLDALAFSVGRVSQFAAISATVAGRIDYFPVYAQVRVLHHPTHTLINAPNSNTSRDLIVTASRLEHPKRIDLLIKAYAKSGVNLPFWIIGTGPQQQELQQLAYQTPGVVLKGRLSDAELVAAYQRACFVPFIPTQEDYGLITIEAFLSGAPVLTTRDAGGPTELVEHQISGWIAEPNVDSLAEGMQRLTSDLARSKQMGLAGRMRAQTITWPDLISKLIQPKTQHRKKVLVLNSFPTEPVVSGGSLRMKGLYSALSDYTDIRMLSLTATRFPYRLRVHNPRFIEEIIPAEEVFAKREQVLSKRLKASCGDLAVLIYPELLTQYRQAVQAELENADEIIFSHPYMFTLVEGIVSEHPELARPFIYDAHNVESHLKSDIYPPGVPEAHAVRAAEVRLLKQAKAVIACSHQDLVSFQDMARSHGFELERSMAAENGLDLSGIDPAPLQQRLEIANTAGKKIALFMGSDHGPNQQALETIALAAQNPEVTAQWDFVILGSVVNHLKRYPIDADLSSLHLIGLVTDEEKRLWLNSATVGLNPIISGSGTNLKLAEYAAYGLPFLSTAFGARGGLWHPGEHYIEIDQNLADSLMALQLDSESIEQIKSMTERSLVLVHDRLHWPAIARNLAGSLWAGESPQDCGPELAELQA